MSEINAEHHEQKGSMWAIALAALGVVYGDIGTSPLYALRECFFGPHAIELTPANVMGVLSLIFWVLISTISIKYMGYVLKADNRGEGGILSLMALASPSRMRDSQKILVGIGLFGAALLFGDGVITPAVTVLSAVEGLEIATPVLKPYVIPITVVVLFILFFFQKHGTARIGAVFGPVITLWFATLGVLGIYGIIKNPVVFEALNPVHAIDLLTHNGSAGFLVLGAVFLVATGGEALYADMGHFGKNPIRLAWFSVALPGLLLNYLGQGALLLEHPEAATNPFYLLAPSWALYPLVILATCASVIASQALISGVFSLTRQAIQLGYSPRLQIVHTSSHTIGQIFLPHVNWALLAATIWLVVSFGSSSALAAAYGISVSTTMVITTLLMYVVCRRVWNWGLLPSVLVTGFFLVIDLAFWGANVIKVAQGGWFPLLIGIVMFTLMATWRKGRQILAERLRKSTIPLAQFIESTRRENVVRVPGSAVFMVGDPLTTPPALVHNVKHNKVLHQIVLVLTVVTREVPHVPGDERVEINALPDDFFRVIAYYGFMDSPDAMEVLDGIRSKGVQINHKDITFFLGRETLLASSRPGMAIWRENLFSFMSRNAQRATAFFNIPVDQVIEVGMQVEL